MVIENGSVASFMGQDSVEAMLREIDKNEDGQIDFDEFLGLMQAVTEGYS
eukprot:NODE_10500_length_304_cov_288.911647.p4 GENE.NODE_10500_length_304_cov_288.911647~~NODE_10500_length_304_cov_288.911647.p4  ORF type:complete len:50 (-),score=18.16 NODE_10500_length_304_cov_288.911647:81-230(-)